MEMFEISYLTTQRAEDGLGYEYYNEKETPYFTKIVEGRILGTENISLSSLDVGHPGGKTTGLNILVEDKIILIKKSWIKSMRIIN